MRSVRRPSPWDRPTATAATAPPPTWESGNYRREGPIPPGLGDEEVPAPGEPLETRLGCSSELRSHHEASDTAATMTGSQLPTHQHGTAPLDQVEHPSRLGSHRSINAIAITQDSLSHNFNPEEETEFDSERTLAHPPTAARDHHLLDTIAAQPTLLLDRETLYNSSAEQSVLMGLSSHDAAKSLAMKPPPPLSSSASWTDASLMHTVDEDKTEEATAQTSFTLQKDDDDTIDSATVASPRLVPQDAALPPPALHVRVPSSTSTAASTTADEGSYRHHHNRTPSWDSVSLEQLHASFPGPLPHQLWQSQPQPLQDRPVFRDEPMMPTTEGRWQTTYHHAQHHHVPQQPRFGAPPPHPFLATGGPHPAGLVNAGMRPPAMAGPPTYMHASLSPQQQQRQLQRRPSGSPMPDRFHGPVPLPPAALSRQYTPAPLLHPHPQQQQQQQPPPHGAMAARPRTQPPGPPMHPTPPLAGAAPPGAGPSGPRSASEVLKTLLRKKACLYEPDTSRAVALVTWLVGRELALEYGFFSRQQLQTGVHACVATKIDAGTITRTKVNRCMQIILNSCFHYIIPRPDGTEEDGSAFQVTFAREASDNDAALLDVLPEPWRNIVVSRDEVLRAIAEMEEGGSMGQVVSTPTRQQASASGLVTPQHSPYLGSQVPDKSPGVHSLDGDGSDQHKRAVLLCFNENVRTAEDVFRCHNEFIRDTAHASHLQLSAQEWRHFFGNEAANAQYLWQNISIPVPYTKFHGASYLDAPGRMSSEEACKFRTSWCTKRYEHDHELCGFAHVEVNGGWLRRNPRTHGYKDEMCPAISVVAEQSASDHCYVIHECPLGTTCQYAHSMEEMLYHPRRYKTRVCSAASRPGGCPLAEVCSNFHPTETYRFPKKIDGRSTRHGKHSHNPSGSGIGINKSHGMSPLPSPILYCSPAPISSFEEHLSLPGLQNLFRRQCFVVRTHLQKNSGCSCGYSNFGDEAGSVEPLSSLPQPVQRGLPARTVRP